MSRRRTCVAFLSAAGVLTLGGCPFFVTRTNNQGGGTIFSAVSKFTSNNMTNLTPDEIQIVTDTVSDLSPQVEILVGDEEAQAAVDFLVANNLNSVQDVAALVEEAGDNPDAVVIPESLQQLIDSGIDIGSILSREGPAARG